jgi:hypothetical protein
VPRSLAHQPLDVLAVDPPVIRAEHRRYPARAQKRPRQEEFVDPTHQRQIVVVVGRLWAVDARARHAEQCALPTDRQGRVVAVEQRSAVRRAHRPDLLAKKML